jgi:hypothetical protein
MYDAKNIINNNSGTDYTYWDVGIMNVWDLETKEWSDGKIEKLFSSLPDNVSIGNAVFSQRSPYIVAFDYINSSNDQYQVAAYNLNTNESGTIFSGSDLGFPCYSKNDDKLLFDAFNNFNEEVIAQAPLASDKINRSGNPTVLISLAKWGVWYANGTRPLLFSAKDITSFAFLGLDPSVTATISGTNITATVPANTDLTKLVASFTSSPYSYVRVGSVIQTSGVNVNNFTTSLVYTVVAQDGSTKNYTVTVTKGAVDIKTPTVSSLTVFPNPANEFLVFGTDNDISSIKVYSISGQLVLEQKLDKHINKIDIRALETGLYVAVLQTSEGLMTCRFVKQR